jgi:hypothetical protein
MAESAEGEGDVSSVKSVSVEPSDANEYAPRACEMEEGSSVVSEPALRGTISPYDIRCFALMI